MTNFERLKQRMTIDEMVTIINEGDDDAACECCVYDNKTCNGDDCKFGIKKWLESYSNVQTH